jgi:transcriptional regulator GlxA family with amidase domain
MWYRFCAYLYLLIVAAGLPCVAIAQHETGRPTKHVGIVLYDGFEVMDVYGPVQMWGYIPDFDIHMIAEQAGPVRSAQGTATKADYSFANAPQLDIVMVPGGAGTRAQLENPALLAYLQRAHKQAEYTTSVCTGSALLAKAGILDGHRATTNKRFFWLSEQQSSQVEWIEQARWVQSDNVFTSAGVTAGTDMALGLIEHLYGSRWASGIASSLEYTWQPDASNDPFTEYTNRLLTEQNGLVSAVPSVAQTLSQAPRWLWLFYEKTPAVGSATIQLFTDEPTPRNIPLVNLHTMGSDDLMIGIEEALLPGRYRVTWQTTLQGEEQMRVGEYHFTITE